MRNRLVVYLSQGSCICYCVLLLEQRSHMTVGESLVTLLLCATIISHHIHSIIFMKWWQVPGPQLHNVFYFVLSVSYNVSKSPVALTSASNSSGIFVFIFVSNKMSMGDSPCFMMLFCNLTAYSVDDGLFPHLFLKDISLFLYHFPQLFI